LRNGTIWFEAWQPTIWHSIRLRVCLESNATANDGSYKVWFDEENVATVTNVDTIDSLANQVQVGQQSTFFFYAFYDDVSIIAEKPEPEPFPTLLVAVASVITTVIVGAGLLVYFRKRKR
jgi:hypothetical protein